MINLKTILLAEDNPNDAELMLEALSESNLINRVFRVKDGVETLEYLQYKGKYKERKKEMPAVLLLDIKMPLLDGIDVLKIIKNEPTLKTLPVVMLTSSHEELDIVKCYQLGVNAYVVKPLDFSEFMNVIKNIGIFWAVINELPSDSEL